MGVYKRDFSKYDVQILDYVGFNSIFIPFIYKIMEESCDHCALEPVNFKMSSTSPIVTVLFHY